MKLSFRIGTAFLILAFGAPLFSTEEEVVIPNMELTSDGYHREFHRQVETFCTALTGQDVDAIYELLNPAIREVSLDEFRDGFRSENYSVLSAIRRKSESSSQGVAIAIIEITTTREPNHGSPRLVVFEEIDGKWYANNFPFFEKEILVRRSALESLKKEMPDNNRTKQ